MPSFHMPSFLHLMLFRGRVFELIQMKEFRDTDIRTAEEKANAFLKSLDESAIVSIHYESGQTRHHRHVESISKILIVYRVDLHER